MKNNLKCLLIAGLGVMSFSAPLHAAEETQSPAERLITVMDFSKTAVQQAKVAFSPMLDQFRAQGIPEEGVKELSAAADRYFTATFSDPAIVKEMAEVYSKTYTDKEIEELLAFYKTPIGQKSLATMPALTVACNKVGMKYAQKNQPQFQKEMQAIVAKYRAAAQAPAPTAPASE